jgi:type IV secretion system protein VirD4
MDPGKRIGEIQTVAAILYPDEQGKDPFWTSQGRAAFTAFASYLFEAWDDEFGQLATTKAPSRVLPDINTSPKFPSLERILRFSSGTDGQSTKEMLQNILKDPSYAFVSPQTRTVFGNLAGLAEQTFSSVIATMQAPLQQFLSPVLAAATNATDIDIGSLRKRPTTLYVIIPTNKLDESSKLLNIFFSTVIGNNLTRQLGEEPDLKYQMLMLMDEFTAMGYEGCKPIRAKKNWFFKDSNFKKRASIEPVKIARVGQGTLTNLTKNIIKPESEQEASLLK